MTRELLQVKEYETVTISSLEVADMINKEHKYLLRDIRHYSDVLTSAKISPVDFWIENTYVDKKSEKRSSYLITRKGCEFIAHKIPGDKGTIFTARYINHFHEMEKQLKNPTPPLKDNRLDIAKLISRTNKAGINLIRELYPEYFAPKEDTDSLEYICDTNTTYTDWINDYGITKEWITSFPTNEIFNNYQRYCVDNKVTGLGKKNFYLTIEKDFNLGRKQCKDGSRYFI